MLCYIEIDGRRMICVNENGRAARMQLFSFLYKVPPIHKPERFWTYMTLCSDRVVHRLSCRCMVHFVSRDKQVQRTMYHGIMCPITYQ